MAAVSISDTPDGRRILALSGRLDSATLPEVWDKARRAAAEAPTRPVVVEHEGLDGVEGRLPYGIGNLRPNASAAGCPQAGGVAASVGDVHDGFHICGMCWG